MPVIPYAIPSSWIAYDPIAIQKELVQAKVAVQVLANTPYQRAWAEKLQEMELKREVAGTSQIEGATFFDNDLDEALSQESPDELRTRSQRQAFAANKTYEWIREIPDDRNIDRDVILDVHRTMVTGADDDHCEPGVLRKSDQNVTFGQPLHRGADGGKVCDYAFNGLCDALSKEYQNEDPIVQGIAVHYHMAAMHPFLDGNGRTARALEALFLQRAGLKDICFVAVSNYYYEEKDAYLTALNESGELGHDLTPFLKFALRGLTKQVERVQKELLLETKKAMFRDVMYDLFHRLESPKRRIIAERQIVILKLLLEEDSLSYKILLTRVIGNYSSLKSPLLGLYRDIVRLLDLGAIEMPGSGEPEVILRINLDWPTQIDEKGFLKAMKAKPKAKTHGFLS